MRRVWWVMLLVVPVAAQTPSPHHSDGQAMLYLTSAELTSGADLTCAGQAKRYILDTQPGQETWIVPTGTSKPSSSCPTRFVYDVSAPFQLGEKVHLTFVYRCASPTVGPPQSPFGNNTTFDPHTFTFYLTNDPNYRGQSGSGGIGGILASDDATGVNADVACLGGTYEQEVELDAREMTLSAGGTLMLLVWTHYVTPPHELDPTVEILVGGRNGSRLEMPGVPSLVTGGDYDDPRPRLLWSAEPTGDTWPTTSCTPDMPVYAMVPGPNGTDPGHVAATTATPLGVGCYVRFEYVATQDMVLEGPITVAIWFMCDGPSYGVPGQFVVRFSRAPEGGGAGEEIAPQAQTANLDVPASCPLTPVLAPLASSLISPNAWIRMNERLRVEAFPSYATPPPNGMLHTVRILTGGEYSSHIRVAGLPWAESMTGVNGTPVAPTPEHETPVPLLAAMLALAMIGEKRRRKQA